MQKGLRTCFILLDKGLRSQLIHASHCTTYMYKGTPIMHIRVRVFSHKFHWVAHMVEQAAFLNPKYVSTYSGETMVRHQASLAHARLNGTAPHKVPEKVLWRFRLGFHLKHVHGGQEPVKIRPCMLGNVFSCVPAKGNLALQKGLILCPCKRELGLVKGLLIYPEPSLGIDFTTASQKRNMVGKWCL